MSGPAAEAKAAKGSTKAIEQDAVHVQEHAPPSRPPLRSLSTEASEVHAASELDSAERTFRYLQVTACVCLPAAACCVQAEQQLLAHRC